jgi:uncharacterized Zn-binding protein involved in type VI secretion
MFRSARLDDIHICPEPGHGHTPIITASRDTVINFKGAARVGDMRGCGAVITAGFPSILINGRPMAYLGSPTSHGGFIVPASDDSFTGFSDIASITDGAVLLGLTGPVVDFAKLEMVKGGLIDDDALRELLTDPDLEYRC